MNFAKFNHVLIPGDAQTRVDWLNSKRGILLRKPFEFFLSLTYFGRFYIFFWLFSLSMGMNVSWTVCYYVSSISTGVLIFALISRKFLKLKDVSITVKTPKRVTAGSEIEFACYIKNSGTKIFEALDIDPPFLTWDGKYTQQPSKLQFLKPDENIIIKSKARFMARGRHSLMPFTIRMVEPFGIAGGPGVSGSLVNFLVIPKITKISSINLQLKMRYQPGGVTMASNTGEAMELAGVRPYQHGDRPKDIHAKTWARTGIPHVLEFHQEYYYRVGIVIDTHISKNNLDEELFENAISVAAGCMDYFIKKDALADLMTCHEMGKGTVTVGRHTGSFESGLDFFAMVKADLNSMDKDYYKKTELMITSTAESLSAVIFICTKADDLNRAVINRFRASNVPVQNILITQKKDVTDAVKDFKIVTIEDIKKKKGLIL
jgi:uncharacterized protein (DUF58 family)